MADVSDLRCKLQSRKTYAMGQRDEKDKMKSRKEKLADYFYSLSKLIFTAMVLGGMSPILTDDFKPTYCYMIIVG